MFLLCPADCNIFKIIISFKQKQLLKVATYLLHTFFSHIKLYHLFFRLSIGDFSDSGTNVECIANFKRLHELDHDEVDDNLEILLHQTVTSRHYSRPFLAQSVAQVTHRLYDVVHRHVVPQDRHLHCHHDHLAKEAVWLLSRTRSYNFHLAGVFIVFISLCAN